MLLGAILGVFTILLVYLGIGWTIDQQEESLFITVLANIIRGMSILFYLTIVTAIIISIYAFYTDKSRQQ